MTADELNRVALMNANGERIDAELIGDLIAEVRRLREVERDAREVMGGAVARDADAAIFNTAQGAGILIVARETRKGGFRRAHFGEVFQGSRRYVVGRGEGGVTEWREDRE